MKNKIRKIPMPPRHAFGAAELRAVKSVFNYYQKRGRDFGYQDHFEQLYTDAFVRYQRLGGFADAVCTGSAALFVAVAALGLPKSSHVLVSPVTDPGTVNAIILNNLVPVVADSEENSFNIGLRQFEERMTSRVKAAVIVHIGGKAAPIDAIASLARRKGVRIIEDASQAHGARIANRLVGTFGDLAAFSTMFGKLHGTGGCGGIIYTRDRRLYEHVRAYADRGKSFFDSRYEEKNPDTSWFPALNLNQDELSCAIGRCTLKKLDGVRSARVRFLRRLNDALCKRSRVCRFESPTREDSPFFQTIRVDTTKIRCSKLVFAKAVAAEGIDLNPDYRYVVCEWRWVQPYLADNKPSTNAIEFRKNSFNLLLNENYGDREVRDIVTAIEKVEKVYVRDA